MKFRENHLNKSIEATDKSVLQNTGKITAEVAKAKPETEFEKYRISQVSLVESDFEKEKKNLKKKKQNKTNYYLIIKLYLRL